MPPYVCITVVYTHQVPHRVCNRGIPTRVPHRVYNSGVYPLYLPTVPGRHAWCIYPPTVPGRHAWCICLPTVPGRIPWCICLHTIHPFHCWSIMSLPAVLILSGPLRTVHILFFSPPFLAVLSRFYTFLARKEGSGGPESRPRGLSDPFHCWLRVNNVVNFSSF